MFKIKIHNDQEKSTSKESKDRDEEVENKGEDEIVEEKLETCYFCLKKFDMNKDELSYYKYGKFPMCGYCAQFYGFYSDEMKIKKEK